MIFWGHRVISALKQRITSEESEQGHYAALEGSVNLDSFQSIARAGRIILASGRKKRRYMLSVKTDNSQHYLFHFITPNSSRQEIIAFSTAVLFKYLVFPLATKTKSQLPFIRSFFNTD